MDISYFPRTMSLHAMLNGVSYRAVRPLILLMGIVLIGCTNRSGPQVKELRDRTPRLNLQVDTTLVIGNEYKGKKNYLFAALHGLCVDDDGNLYVADPGRMGIRKYDSTGEYIKTFGQRGEGPGEFTELLDITITDAGQIVALDGFHVSVFTLSGKHIETHQLGGELYRGIHPLPDDNYLLLDHNRTSIDSLFHIFSPSFELLATFGAIRDFSRVDAFTEEAEYEDITLRSWLGHVAVMSSDRVVYAPPYYYGYIYNYRKNEGRWGLAGRYRGFVMTTEHPYTQVDRPRKRQPRTYEVATSGGPMWLTNKRSMGLHKTASGHLLHFTAIDSADTRVFGLELYNHSGRFLGYGRIGTISHTDYGVAKRMSPWVEWVDSKGNMYWRIYGFGVVPHIKRVHLKIRGRDVTF